MMWLGIVALAVILGFLFMPEPAKADILLPVPALVKVSISGEIRPFLKQTSPALVEERCQSLLPPAGEAGRTRLDVSSAADVTSRSRRNAGTGEASVVDAIKAYRDCARLVALEELAGN